MILIATLAAIFAAVGTTAEAPEKATAQTYSAASITHDQRVAVWRSGKAYLGQPYVAGGLDCSRLTQLAYRNGAGISLFDDPQSQMQRGRWVRDARKGDLLFWSENGSGIATHVGIARGDGLMTLHASSYYGRTVISDGSYIRGYLGAKRLL